MSAKITKTLLCLMLSLLFLGCKPQPKKHVLKWPYTATTNTVTFKRLTRITVEGQSQTGLSLYSKEPVNFATDYDTRRTLLYPGTNHVVWLPLGGDYAFPYRGEIKQGASMKLGIMNYSPVIFHVIEPDFGGLRTMHMEGVASEISKEPVSANAVAKMNNAEIENLVLELRSQNLDPAPFGWESGIPVNYDLEAQKRVWRAQAKIRALGIRAFPALVAHLEDKEYSYTEEYSKLVSFSAGHACYRLIEAQVDIAGAAHQFKDRKPQKTMYDGSFYYTILHNKYDGSVINWWEANKHRSLEDIQLESVEWLIGKEKELGFINPEQEQKVLEPLQVIRSGLVAKLAK